MKEELIAFDTAKLAKEKGFNIPCNDFYDLYDNPNNKNLSYSLKDNWNDYKSYSAPTQSLLQKWLREVHEIYVITRPYKMSDKYKFFVTISSNEDNPTFENKFDTYEEALEKGLQKALKLIK